MKNHPRTSLLNILFLFLASLTIHAKEITVNNPFKTAVFIENNGQFNGWGKTNGQILFGIDRMDQVRFTSNEFIYHLRKGKHLRGEEEDEGKEEEESQVKITDSYIKAIWVNANPNVRIETEEKQQGYFTYCVYDADPSSMRGVVANGYKKIIYREMYPGIDVEVIIPQNEGGIKYTLHCLPGADLSQVKIRYEGDIKSMKLSGGNIIIKSDAGVLTEHAPVSNFADGISVATPFRLSGRTITFDNALTVNSPLALIVDPWVSSNLSNLTTQNEGYDVDIDYLQNLYVYGGGDPGGLSTTEFKVAKYDPAGNLLWTFNGAVSTIPWSSVGNSYNCPSNFLVEKTTGRCYVGETFQTAGTQVIRIASSGVYDNFVSNVNADMIEIWDMAFNCTNGEIYACGGGMTTNNNFGIIDPITGGVTVSNITGYPGGHQDIVTATVDNSGTMFTVLSSISVSQVHNHLFQVNNTFNGNVWNRPTGFNTLVEPNNKSYLNFTGVTGNGSSVLAVNDQYIFYYDGLNLAAYQKSTGNQVGSNIIVNASYQVNHQSGIAVDNCNTVYVGGIGVIHSFSFNGTTFLPLGTISLNTTSLAKVHDLKYDWSTNALFACGSDFVGMFDANQSQQCNNLDLSVNSNCGGGANVSVSTLLTGATLSYTWMDSIGNTIANHNSTSHMDSISGLADGMYLIRVQVSPLCGGPNVTDTVYVSSSAPINPGISATNPRCFGEANGQATAILADTTGYAFTWSTSPPQYTSQASGLIAGNYTVTVTNIAGCAASTSVTLVDPVAVNVTVTGSTTICPGTSVVLSALGTGGSGTIHFAWDNGQTASSITVSPQASSAYTCIVTDDNNCTSSSAAMINLHPLPVADAGPDERSCSGETKSIGLPPSTGFTYQWIPPSGLSNPLASQTAVTLFNATNHVIQNQYRLIVEDANGCHDTDMIVMSVNPVPLASFPRPPTQCLSDSGFVFIPYNSVSGTLEYIWSFGPDATPQNSNAIYPPRVHYSSLGTHVVTVYSSIDGCPGPPYSDTVFLAASPVADFDNNLIEGCVPLTVNFSNLSSSNSTHYFWNFNDGNTASDVDPVHTFYTSGTYSVILSAITDEGCIDRKIKQSLIEVYPLPRAGFYYTPGTANNLSPSYSFFNTTIDGDKYAWDFGDGNTSNEFESWHTYPDTGRYRVSLITTSPYGCIDSIDAILIVEGLFTFYIPNAFTPNSDHKNDFFQGYGTYLKSYEMTILNRWGREIYHTYDYNKPWDGTDPSAEQSEVYIYKFRVSDVFDNFHDYIGHFSLIR